MNSYPTIPGHKRSGCSADAAEAMQVSAPTIQQRVLDLLRSRPMTPDECAVTLGKSLLSVRPRCSELIALGLVEETGERHRNTSGLMAAVLRAKQGGAE